MRRHGWSGDIPRDDEAAGRILDAARRAIDDGQPVTISTVAQSLGITRQTVYRYFPTQEALLAATALSSIDAFLDRLARQLGAISDPTQAVVEESRTRSNSSHTTGICAWSWNPARRRPSPRGDVRRGDRLRPLHPAEVRHRLGRRRFRWRQAGRARGVHAPDPAVVHRRSRRTGASGDGLRAYLRDWVAPAVRARAEAPTSSGR